MKKTKKFIGLWLDESTEQKLREKADKQARSLSAEIRVMLDEQLCPEKQEEGKNE